MSCLRLSSIMLLLIAAALIFSCSDDEKIVNIDDPDIFNVEVTGTVYAYYCNPYQEYNGSDRYTVSTGMKATIEFLRVGDYSYIFKTDDSSNYEMQIDTGTYDIVLKNDHAFPDTIMNVEIAGDTVIDFEFLYATLWPDTLSLEFYYNPDSDSLGESTQVALMNSLNGALGHILDIDQRIRRDHHGGYGSYGVYYEVPFDTGYYFWEVWLAATSELEAAEHIFPYEMDVHFLPIMCLF